MLYEAISQRFGISIFGMLTRKTEVQLAYTNYITKFLNISVVHRETPQLFMKFTFSKTVCKPYLFLNHILISANKTCHKTVSVYLIAHTA